jgi:hypothetical protein
LVAIEVAQKPVAADAAFGKDQQLDVAVGRLLDEAVHGGAIRRGLAVAMMKLNGRRAEVLHRLLLIEGGWIKR